MEKNGIVMRVFTEAVEENLKLNFEEMRQKKHTLTSYPFKLFIDVTSRCNLDCIICGRKYIKNEDMSMELFDKIEKEFFDKVAEVDFYLTGESSLSSNLIEMLDRGSKYSFVPKIFTNASCLRQETIDAFAMYGVFVNISVDAAAKTEFERIRKGADFDVVKANISKLVAARKNAHPRYHLRFVMTVRSDNIDQVLGVMRLANELGVRDITFSFYDGFDSTRYMVFHKEKELLKIVPESFRLAEKYKMRISWPQKVCEKEFHAIIIIMIFLCRLMNMFRSYLKQRTRVMVIAPIHGRRYA